MKKLMTAFAACLMAGLVSAQVESQNIVGYQSNTANLGATLYTPMFTSVGGGDVTLGQITGDFVEYTDTLQILDETLAMVAQYTWIDVGAGPVWSSDGSTDDSGITIPVGRSVLISSAAAVVLNSGEVKLTTTDVVCGSGVNLLGNPLPREMTLGEMGFVGLVEYSDTLQILDETLAMVAQYTWIDVGAGPVWSSDGSADDSATPLASGAGFLLSSQDGCTVTFPAVL